MISKPQKLGLFYIACLIAMLPILASAKTVVVGIEPAYAPWAYVENGEYEGIAPDALRTMAKQQDFDVKFKSLPFESLIPALRAEKIDVVATALTVSKKRAQKIAFTVPWWQVNMDVLVRKGSDTNIVTALCCGARVGTQSGTTVRQWLQDSLKANGVDIDVHTYSAGTTGVRDLISGRLDSYISDETPAHGFQKHHSDKIRIAGTVKSHPPQVYALGVRKGDKKLLGLLNKAEVQLYESEKWAEIIHQYLPDASITKVPGSMPSDIPSYQKPIPGLAQ
ncbi:amino acid ABC transporter substrate-binding protein [Salinisphaera sp. USBA-960]|uniref:ABC transporter substrate-binding protein n=1 Tax=Salinisphaera orenii TaxID=856731 RepID=UPI000DBE08F7|nr:amino acid ABC transporter substrate-binding protein [Salifodinibacter halophilus]NNC25730.1 amino acid ABC transporter substrate-binding protein [Salifodinibacter halophilus]